jgi:adenine deaminase
MGKESARFLKILFSLSFLALSVTPELKITDRGLIDVSEFRVIPLEAP